MSLSALDLIFVITTILIISLGCYIIKNRYNNFLSTCIKISIYIIKLLSTVIVCFIVYFYFNNIKQINTQALLGIISFIFWIYSLIIETYASCIDLYISYNNIYLDINILCIDNDIEKNLHKTPALSMEKEGKSANNVTGNILNADSNIEAENQQDIQDSNVESEDKQDVQDSSVKTEDEQNVQDSNVEAEDEQDSDAYTVYSTNSIHSSDDEQTALTKKLLQEQDQQLKKEFKELQDKKLTEYLDNVKKDHAEQAKAQEKINQDYGAKVRQVRDEAPDTKTYLQWVYKFQDQYFAATEDQRKQLLQEKVEFENIYKQNTQEKTESYLIDQTRQESTVNSNILSSDKHKALFEKYNEQQEQLKAQAEARGEKLMPSLFSSDELKEMLINIETEDQNKQLLEEKTEQVENKDKQDTQEKIQSDLSNHKKHKIESSEQTEDNLNTIKKRKI